MQNTSKLGNSELAKNFDELKTEFSGHLHTSSNTERNKYLLITYIMSVSRSTEIPYVENAHNVRCGFVTRPSGFTFCAANAGQFNTPAASASPT